MKKDQNQLILGIETSCDDTCAAVICGSEILANVAASQETHDRFGGVVPEIAARQHLEVLPYVVRSALERADIQLGELDAVAVTQGPGLVGSLLVGLAYAKALAFAVDIPLIPVDHLEGHIAANYLAPHLLKPPFLCLLASGGHTLLIHVRHYTEMETIGQTLDDAAGEAIDKGARLLGLPFPGGPALQQLATQGDPCAFQFPTASAVKGFDFSFSGVKTALLYATRGLAKAEFEAKKADLAASYQLAIVDALIARVQRALEATGLHQLAIGGGVAANSLLRERCQELGVNVTIPALKLCTDNAAMIASAARFIQPLAPASDTALTLDAYPRSQRLVNRR